MVFVGRKTIGVPCFATYNLLALATFSDINDSDVNLYEISKVIRGSTEVGDYEGGAEVDTAHHGGLRLLLNEVKMVDTDDDCPNPDQIVWLSDSRQRGE